MNATAVLLLLEGPSTLRLDAPELIIRRSRRSGTGLYEGVRRRAGSTPGLTPEALWLLVEGSVGADEIPVDRAA